MENTKNRYNSVSCNDISLVVGVRLELTTFGLWELREEKGLTQQALADELGIGIQSIRNYENDSLDRIPSTVQLKMLKDFYGVTYEYLLDEDCNNRTTETVSNKKDEIQYSDSVYFY